MQQATLKTFGQIHDTNSVEDIEKIIELLQSVITSLPANQSESIMIEECYPGFLDWNKYWSESFSNAKALKPELSATQYVHVYY